MVETFTKKIIRKFLLKLFHWALPELCEDIMGKVYKLRLQERWRERNKHNSTSLNLCMCQLYNADSVIVGNNVYGKLNVYSWGTKEEKLQIGNFCSIANNVHFILGGNHYLNHFSTYPFKRMVLGDEEQEAVTKGPIVLEDDVWIGQDSIILSGSTIGRGSVIAAGSVVTKSVEPYSIVGGNPARLIRYRFDDELRLKMMSVNFEKLDNNFVTQNIEKLYSDSSEDIIDILQQLQ